MVQFRVRINILNRIKGFYHYVATYVLLDSTFDNNLVPEVGNKCYADKVALERHSE